MSKYQNYLEEYMSGLTEFNRTRLKENVTKRFTKRFGKEPKSVTFDIESKHTKDEKGLPKFIGKLTVNVSMKGELLTHTRDYNNG